MRWWFLKRGLKKLPHGMARISKIPSQLTCIKFFFKNLVLLVFITLSFRYYCQASWPLDIVQWPGGLKEKAMAQSVESLCLFPCRALCMSTLPQHWIKIKQNSPRFKLGSPMLNLWERVSVARKTGFLW